MSMSSLSQSSAQCRRHIFAPRPRADYAKSGHPILLFSYGQNVPCGNYFRFRDAEKMKFQSCLFWLSHYDCSHPSFRGENFFKPITRKAYLVIETFPDDRKLDAHGIKVHHIYRIIAVVRYLERGGKATCARAGQFPNGVPIVLLVDFFILTSPSL